MDDKCVASFPSLAQQPSVNIHILVEFDTEPKMYYVGLVMKPIYDEEDHEVSIMRRKCSTWEFTFLAIDDIASIKLTDIKAILPEPNQCGTTSRQKSSYFFCYDFHCSKCELKSHDDRSIYLLWTNFHSDFVTFAFEFLNMLYYLYFLKHKSLCNCAPCSVWVCPIDGAHLEIWGTFFKRLWFLYLFIFCWLSFIELCRRSCCILHNKNCFVIC